MLITGLSACSQNSHSYFREPNNHGIEKYEYNRPYPNQIGCQVYYSPQPMKRSTYKRLKK